MTDPVSNYVSSTLEKTAVVQGVQGVSNDVFNWLDGHGLSADTAGADTPKVTNPSGVVMDGSDINVTWSALNAGSSASLGMTDMQILQGIIGTVVITYPTATTVGSQPNPVPTVFAPQQDIWANLSEWVGTVDSSAPGAGVDQLVCNDMNCLTPTQSLNTSYTPLANRIYTVLTNMVSDIQTNTPITASTSYNDGVMNVNPFAIINATTLPVAKIVQIAASTTYGSIGNQMLKKWTPLIAYDIAAKNMHSVLSKAALLVHGKKQFSDPGHTVTELMERIQSEIQEVNYLDNQIQEKEGTLRDQMTLVNDIQRAMYADLNTEIIQNIQFDASSVH